MLREEEIIREIAKRKGMDTRVVSMVARYPFHFLKDVIASPTDLRPVRLKYFGLFVLKTRYYKGMVPKNITKAETKLKPIT